MITLKKIQVKKLIILVGFLVLFILVGIISFLIQNNRLIIDNKAQEEPIIHIDITSSKNQIQVNEQVTILVKAEDIGPNPSLPITGMSLALEIPKPLTVVSSQILLGSRYKDITVVDKGSYWELQALVGTKLNEPVVIQEGQTILSFVLMSTNPGTARIKTVLNTSNILAADGKTKVTAGITSDVDITIQGDGSTVTNTPTPTISVSISPTATPTESLTPTATVTPTINVTSTVTPSPTPTPSPITTVQAGNITLNFEVRFQGITTQSVHSPQEVSVSLIQEGNLVIDTSKISVTSQANGIWRGSKNYTNIDITKKYYIKMKGPKHLAKKICELVPKESEPGKYTCDNKYITLTRGANTFNLSNITLIAGDIPSQTGVIDAVDITYIRSNLGSSEAEKTQKADLNFDGIVDTQDYSLILYSLSKGFKYDE